MTTPTSVGGVSVFAGVWTPQGRAFQRVGMRDASGGAGGVGSGALRMTDVVFPNARFGFNGRHFFVSTNYVSCTNFVSCTN